jgi:hypothetical protein
MWLTEHLLPVVITAGAPDDLTSAADRRGEGEPSLATVLEILGCNL